jgi:hypothetical protein
VRGVGLIAVFSVAGALASREATAAPNRPGRGGDIGIGATVGDPVGVAFKWVGHPRHALDAGLGFGPFHLGGGRVHAGWQFLSRPWAQSDELAVVGGIGVGAGVAFWHKRYVGPGTPDQFRGASVFFRAPAASLSFNFMKLPIDVFLEAAYSPLVGPPLTWWNFDFALGVRGWW